MRIDFIFSYWIFAWYLLYLFKNTYNPKVALFIGLLENATLASMMIYYQNKNIWSFLIVITFLKIIPYFSITKPMHYRDLYPTMALFSIYLIWLKVNGQSYTKMLHGTHAFVKGKVEFPATKLINKLLNNLRIIYN